MINTVITRRSLIADGVVSLDLAAPDLPEWSPGAHIDLHLRADLIRQYSLCGDSSNRSHYQIAVLDSPDGRGGSRLVHALAEGDDVEISAPRNHFPLVDSPNYLFLAGGIGITPLLPMLATTPNWRLVYGGRTRASMAFANELVDRYGDRVTLWPQDERGLLDLATELGTPQPETVVYCCGPEPLLAAVETACLTWPPNSLHVERFTPQEDTAERLPFTVELAATGQTLDIPVENTILEVLEQHGIPAMSSCAEGTCGTCETTILAGTPDHRDSVLSPAEREAGKSMMICVSRASTPHLVLDL
ncbi:PDR/VanB family oxidoreductase [Actinokineospora enzanensis]|uniref:PDR/VanB family oxidoreductase n=1 Tax=Actinokineospora enzanensis TaxID=155975 RepID=UPI000365EFE2|nr:PDR/VanB family oxidoreductase [Actinokineospora enzanensis]